MLLEDIKNIKSTRKDLRNFGLVVGVALCLLGGVFWLFGKPAALYLLIPGGILIVCGLMVPGILLPMQKVWMTFAVVMGWVMSRVILSILFFLVFTPMGLIARLFGKRFLSFTWKSGDTTYWHYRERIPYDKKRSEMQF